MVKPWLETIDWKHWCYSKSNNHWFPKKKNIKWWNSLIGSMLTSGGIHLKKKIYHSSKHPINIEIFRQMSTETSWLLIDSSDSSPFCFDSVRSSEYPASIPSLKFQCPLIPLSGDPHARCFLITPNLLAQNPNIKNAKFSSGFDGIWFALIKLRPGSDGWYKTSCFSELKNWCCLSFHEKPCLV